MDTKQVLKKAIELYTDGVVTDIKVYPDPRVEGSYGIRTIVHPVTRKGRVSKAWKQLDFILLAHWMQESDELTPELAMKWLEDAVFKTWPPQSGSPRFFI